MAVPKRKTSKSKTKMRRAANSKMVATGFVSCPQCHEPKLPHRVCPDCGYYKGKEVVILFRSWLGSKESSQSKPFLSHRRR